MAQLFCRTIETQSVVWFPYPLLMQGGSGIM